MTLLSEILRILNDKPNLLNVYDNTGESSPNRIAKAISENSLHQLGAGEMPPDAASALQRTAVRSIVVLTLVEVDPGDSDAMIKMKGAVSWVSKAKVDASGLGDMSRESVWRECSHFSLV